MTTTVQTAAKRWIMPSPRVTRTVHCRRLARELALKDLERVWNPKCSSCQICRDDHGSRYPCQTA